MIFQQSEAELAEDVNAVDHSVVSIKKRQNNYFKVTVSNSTNHDVILRKNRIIGKLEYVKSVIPLQGKPSTQKICKAEIKSNGVKIQTINKT